MLLVLLLVLAVTGVMLSAITSALAVDASSNPSSALPAYLAADVAMATVHFVAVAAAAAWLAFGRYISAFLRTHFESCLFVRWCTRLISCRSCRCGHRGACFGASGPGAVAYD